MLFSGLTMATNMYRDKTMDPAKARHLQVVWRNRVRRLAKQTAFSDYELQCLSLIFHKICKTYEWWGKRLPGRTREDRLDRMGFRDGTSVLMDMPHSTALDALFCALDLNNKRYLTAPRWMRALSSLNGTNVEKALMCWKAYTRAAGGNITRADMVAHARGMFMDVGQDDFDGFCKEFVDMMLKGTKAFKEGYMTLQEYLDIITSKPLYMEFLMTVLPSRHAMRTFLSTFSPLLPRATKRSKSPDGSRH